MSSFNFRNDFGARPASVDVPTLPATCPACRSSSITTTAKSPDANSYWRCAACGEVWNVARRQEVRRPASTWR